MKIIRIVLLLIPLIFFATLLMAAGQDQTGKLYPVRQQGKWGFINREGKIVIRPQFDGAEEFTEDLAPVQIGNKHGYIDRAGKIVIPPRFDQAIQHVRVGGAARADDASARTCR